MTNFGSKMQAHLSDPFGEDVLSAIRSSIDSPQPLIDVPAAKLWFEAVSRGCRDSLYTYQIPLDKATGVDTVALASPVVMFSSYSYLSLNQHPRISEAARRAVEKYGTTTGGVRMLTGTLDLHVTLEEELAAFLGCETATVYTSGYDANVAAITTLFGPGDTAILDQFAHRSLQDAVQMAGCEALRFAHNRLDRLETHLRRLRSGHGGRVLIVVDGVYSMDGDEAPLAGLIALKEEYGAFLLVDDAHSVGVKGSHGQGSASGQGVDVGRIDILTGSLGKAIPSSGGYVGGSFALKALLQHHSAPYFFSGSLSPANSAAALESLRVIKQEPHHLEALRANADVLRSLIEAAGLNYGVSTSPIVPLILGSEDRAWRWARTLLDHGIIASAVPFPAVPIGQSRLRLCATSGQQPQHFEQLARGLAACLEAEAVASIPLQSVARPALATAFDGLESPR